MENEIDETVATFPPPAANSDAIEPQPIDSSSNEPQKQVFDRSWLRSRWEFAACTQFLHLFWSTFKLGDEVIDSEDFESCLLQDSSCRSEDVEMFTRLCVQLMKVITHNRHISAENWVRHILRLTCPELLESLQQNSSTGAASVAPPPPHTETDDAASSADENSVDISSTSIAASVPASSFTVDEFLQIPLSWTPKDRLMKFHQLTELATRDPDRFRSHAAEKDPDDQVHWRVDPVGWDCYDRIYWLFDDHRLYRETYPSCREQMQLQKEAANDINETIGTRRGQSKKKTTTKKKPTIDPLTEQLDDAEWELLCSSIDDWNQLIDSHLQPLVHPDSKQHRTVRQKQLLELISALRESVIPDIVPILEQKEREKKSRDKIKRQLGVDPSLAIDDDWTSRKRSTRLVYKESAKMAEEYGLSSLHQSRSERHAEIERKRAENEREQRAKEREWRLLRREESMARQQLGTLDGSDSSDEEYGARKSRGKAKMSKKKSKQKNKRQKKVYLSESESDDDSSSVDDYVPESSEETEEDDFTQDKDDSTWFFNCVCGKKGRNYDDDLPMMACGRCNVWLHIDCAEKAIERESGFAKKWDWSKDEFLCWPCRAFTAHQKGSKAKRKKTEDTDVDVMNTSDSEDLKRAEASLKKKLANQPEHSKQKIRIVLPAGPSPNGSNPVHNQSIAAGQQKMPVAPYPFPMVYRPAVLPNGQPMMLPQMSQQAIQSGVPQPFLYFDPKNPGRPPQLVMIAPQPYINQIQPRPPMMPNSQPSTTVPSPRPPSTPNTPAAVQTPVSAFPNGSPARVQTQFLPHLAAVSGSSGGIPNVPAETKSGVSGVTTPVVSSAHGPMPASPVRPVVGVGGPQEAQRKTDAAVIAPALQPPGAPIIPSQVQKEMATKAMLTKTVDGITTMMATMSQPITAIPTVAKTASVQLNAQPINIERSQVSAVDSKGDGHSGSSINGTTDSESIDDDDSEVIKETV